MGNFVELSEDGSTAHFHERDVVAVVIHEDYRHSVEVYLRGMPKAIAVTKPAWDKRKLTSDSL
jgi:hypothetical protein